MWHMGVVLELDLEFTNHCTDIQEIDSYIIQVLAFFPKFGFDS